VTSFVFHRQMTIVAGHCDPAGMVSTSRYFEFFDANTWMLFEMALGTKRQDIAATFSILGFPVVDARVNLLKPVKFGNVIDITSRVARFGRSSFDVEHHISIDSELAVDGRESRVWAVRDADDSNNFKSVAIPTEVVIRLS
jgi:4-hydroxybenzoyl-CoA thioesterase